jgi:hypothetical protein
MIDGERDGLRASRRVVRGCLHGCGEELQQDAELVATEMITNALLHAGPPIHLRVTTVGRGARVEVGDASRALPVRPLRTVSGMTGRGLALLDALTESWGTDLVPNGGKVVWAQLGTSLGQPPARPELSSDELLAQWADDQLSEPRYTVRLGVVATDLLLAAKEHIDSVVRELTLATNNSAAKDVLTTEQLSLTEAVLRDFAEPRTQIKQQAVAAAQRGDVVTDLQLHLPLKVADVADRYLEALGEVDRYARAARMLTMAPTRSHRIFRDWYVRALKEQLRAYGRGDDPPQAASLQSALAEELDRLAPMEEAWRRLRLLQQVTEDLTGSHSAAEIAEVVVHSAVQFPGVETTRVFLLDSNRMLRSAARQGQDLNTDRFPAFSLDAELPGALVARTGKPLYFRNRDELYSRFPLLVDAYEGSRSLHIRPLIVGQDTVGILALTFEDGELAPDDQLSFVQALADIQGRALERALTIERLTSSA